MIKILKYGPLRRVACPGCGSLLSYDEREDVETEQCENYNIGSFTSYELYEKYITCPQCNERIVLNPCREIKENKND